MFLDSQSTSSEIDLFVRSANSEAFVYPNGSREVTYNVGKSFNVFPSGRTAEDGLYNGQLFRKILLHWLSDPTVVKLRLFLDDAFGYGSSFLDESFQNIFNSVPEELRKTSRLQLHSSDPALIDEIETYINKTTTTL